MNAADEKSQDDCIRPHHETDSAVVIAGYSEGNDALAEKVRGLSGHQLRAALQTIPVSEFAFLTTLHFADRHLGDDGVIFLTSRLTAQLPSHLKSLSLNGNAMTARSVDAICDVINAAQELTELSIDWNDIGVDGLHTLCSALSHNRSVTSLSLRNNRLPSAAAKALSHLLSQNRTLRHLDCRWNSLGIDGAQYIYDALTYNNILESCLLTGNHCDSHTLVAITALCHRNTHNNTSNNTYEQALNKVKTLNHLQQNDYKLIYNDLKKEQEKNRNLEKNLEILQQTENDISIRYNHINEWKNTSQIQYENVLSERLILNDQLNELKNKLIILEEAHLITQTEKKNLNQIILTLEQEKSQAHLTVDNHENNNNRIIQTYKLEINKLNNQILTINQQNNYENSLLQNKITELEQNLIEKDNLYQLNINKEINKLRDEQQINHTNLQNLYNQKLEEIKNLEQNNHLLRENIINLNLENQNNINLIEKRIYNECHEIYNHKLNLFENKLNNLISDKTLLNQELSKQNEIFNEYKINKDNDYNLLIKNNNQQNIINNNNESKLSLLQIELSTLKKESNLKDEQINTLQQSLNRADLERSRAQQLYSDEIEEINSQHRIILETNREQLSLLTEQNNLYQIQLNETQSTIRLLVDIDQQKQNALITAIQTLNSAKMITIPTSTRLQKYIKKEERTSDHSPVKTTRQVEIKSNH